MQPLNLTSESLHTIGFLLKLYAIGIRGHLLKRIKAYLSEQWVMVNGCHSQWGPVTYGVPYRGPYLAHQLFFVHVNATMAMIFPLVHIFGDNCVFYKKITSRMD